ncbi:MAG: DUF2079 domain-containing protein [Acidobacteriota bacterium]|nr:DUF2079 domain-containing protein [Acidobacteriota bacterium]
MDARSSTLTRAIQSGWAALLLFAGLSVAATWPLARGLGRDVPGDYGDPLFTAWAMAWVSRQAGRALTGHLDAITQLWSANQLYPEPAALSLSDHFIAQALPLAPAYWVTHNALLVLGLAYLIAFTLNGFCAWLLAREITGSAAAGVLAGCTFAFQPFFLVYEISHLQVISAWGMPLALYGLRRYFARGALSGLLLGAAGVILLSLSAGYYMVMFPLFILLYAGWEIMARRRWSDGRMWGELVFAGAGVVVALAPVLKVYVETRQRLGLVRSAAETTQMSASMTGYADALWPLMIPFSCAAVAVTAALAARVGPSRHRPPLTGLVVIGAALAFWLSLGPSPVLGGRAFPALGLYRLLLEFVPGMDALRVSSRFAVAFVLFLSMGAGLGAAVLARARRGAVVVVVLAIVSVWLNTPPTFPLNRELPSTAGVRPPAAYLAPAPRAPAVYRYLASLPASSVIAELPFTDLWYTTRYLYFSTFHWHPLVNGFTSFFPPDFDERVRWLVNPVRTPDEAFGALQAAGTTHVVVHTGAWDEDYVGALEDWLVARGARSHGTFDGAAVYEIGRARLENGVRR